MQGNRAARVSEEIQKLVGEIFSMEIRIPELGLVTISRVKCTNDLKIADIYFSLYRSALEKDKALKILNGKKKQIRQTIAREIKLKYVPELRFYIDDTLDYVDRIEELIQKIHDE